MNELEFQQFLHNNIPITDKMGVEVLELKPSRVRLRARLEPNLNPHGTAFGGSINTLMLVCGWSTVFENVIDHDVNSHIVIRKSSIEYLSPITNDIIAECTIENQEIIEKLLADYDKFGKAKIDLTVVCMAGEKTAARFNGQYVVFK
ncbi:MAG: YiiD C-terminal domain-containing protein [Syntrophomonas sp.]